MLCNNIMYNSRLCQNDSMRTLCGTAQTCKSLSGAQRTEMRGREVVYGGKGSGGGVPRQSRGDDVALRSNKWTARGCEVGAGVSRWGGREEPPSRTKSAHLTLICSTRLVLSTIHTIPVYPPTDPTQEGQMSLITTTKPDLHNPTAFNNVTGQKEGSKWPKRNLQ